MPKRIFDFDKTVTKKHTFPTDRLEYYREPSPVKSSEELMALGADKARSNLKDGLTPELFSLDEDHLFSIAT